jgi:hypothetical protein
MEKNTMDNLDLEVGEDVYLWEEGKDNYDKQEISHLKKLIEIKKNKIKIPGKKEWELKKILFG